MEIKKTEFISKFNKVKEQNKNLNNILLLILLVSIFYGLEGSIVTASFIKLEAKFFSRELLSKLFMFGSIIGCLQIFLQKLPIKYSLYIPIFLQLITWILTPLILVFTKNILIIFLFINPITFMFCFHRGMKINDIIKKQCDISFFADFKMSILEFFSIIGFLLSWILASVISPVYTIFWSNFLGLIPVILGIIINQKILNKGMLK